MVGGGVVGIGIELTTGETITDSEKTEYLGILELDDIPARHISELITEV